jgi:catalase
MNTAPPLDDGNDPEQRLIDEIATDTVTLLDRRYPKPTPILRGVHPKSHGCLKGSFTIDPNLPENLRVGLFAEPGKCYQAVVRYSNAAATVACDLLDDQNGSRGMAIKVMNVVGEVLEKDGQRDSQDFLMINTPGFAFANIKDYHRLTKVLLEHNDNPLPFFDVVSAAPEDIPGIEKSGKVLQEIGGKPVANPAEVSYFGAAPFGFGPTRVMRFKAKPRVAPEPQAVPAPASCNYLNEALSARMAENEGLVFDFELQVRDLADVNDMEDATASWDENDFPFEKVATLELDAPQSEINSDTQRQACEDLVFTPWHALGEHEPLGGINRMRKKVYDASSEHRCPFKHD